MVGIYFSGTGNTEHCVNRFLAECGSAGNAVSIEDRDAVRRLQEDTDLVFACPVYYSSLPLIARNFIERNGSAFLGKRVFVIATMGLFSGDGSGYCARLLKKHGAEITGGLHLTMPDCIGDVKLLKRTLEQNRSLVRKADEKIKIAAENWKAGSPPQEGLGTLSHLAGLFGQRLWFGRIVKTYSNKLKINPDLCVGCGKCVSLCPMDNLSLSIPAAKDTQEADDAKVTAVPNGRCTLCYRCVDYCPQKAITLLGKQVWEQCRMENYL